MVELWVVVEAEVGLWAVVQGSTCIHRQRCEVARCLDKVVAAACVYQCECTNASVVATESRDQLFSGKRFPLSKFKRSEQAGARSDTSYTSCKEKEVGGFSRLTVHGTSQTKLYCKSFSNERAVTKLPSKSTTVSSWTHILTIIPNGWPTCWGLR
jgi:hypothetical protein